LKVLVAPLDWGLGHATRCVPLVRFMVQLGWKVSLAGEGPSLTLLSQEFPELTTIPLKGYRIQYPKSGALLIPRLLVQIPKILKTIKLENEWLEESFARERWDLVISDNRYGLSTPNTKCIFITHQVWVLSGWGNQIDQLLNKRLHQWISKFNQCWIPDERENGGIAGVLSHPPVPSSLFPVPYSPFPVPYSLFPVPSSLFPIPLTYLGPLSRLTKQNCKEGTQILVLLSGPEPQRSLLEQKLLEQIKQIDEQFLFVRGLPSASKKPENTKNIHFENHLASAQLSQAISSAKLVVCRSGYSSVMDLLKMEKKAILIPTPGQTEQLYLGKELAAKKWFVTQKQEELQLNTAIQICLSDTQVRPFLNFEAYKQVLADLGTQ
jgi:UDP-N-acetylglucosamine transferase subunit ALG13